MKYVKSTMSPKDRAQMEHMSQMLHIQEEKIETNNLITRYIAEMSDIYIPEEKEEEDVQDIVKTERPN